MVASAKNREDLVRIIRHARMVFVLKAVADLKVADEVGEDPVSVDDIATRIGVPREYLFRVLRACSKVGVFSIDKNLVSHTDGSREFRSICDAPIKPLFDFVLDGRIIDPWLCMGEALKVSQTPFEYYHGDESFSFFSKNKDLRQHFDGMLAAVGGSQEESLLETIDFNKFNTVMDVGGGTGELLKLLLDRYTKPNGILFDLDHVIEKCTIKDDRMSLVKGSFFDSVPRANAMILKKVLHDWSDESSILILEKCKEALEDSGHIYVVDTVLDTDKPEKELSKIMMDIEMIVMTTSGRERSEADFRRIGLQAGLELNKISNTSGVHSIVDFIKV